MRDRVVYLLGTTSSSKNDLAAVAQLIARMMVSCIIQRIQATTLTEPMQTAKQ